MTLLALAAASAVASAEEIKDIVVGDTDKTASDTVRTLARIDVGDDWTPDMAKLIEERLVSSGLFKDVSVYWDPYNGGVRVHILAKDKLSQIAAPAFYDQPTNKGGGIGYGNNNLFGLDQKLLMYAQIATGDSFFLGVWQVPSINGTRFHSQLDTYLADIRNIEYSSPTGYLQDEVPVRDSRLIYLNGGAKIGVDIVHGVKLDARVRGASVGYRDVHFDTGATLANSGVDPATVAAPPAPGRSGWDVSSEVDFTVDRHADWYGVASGYRFGALYEQSLPSLGSDFHYYDYGFWANESIRVLERHNLVLKGSVNVGHHLPFQQEFTMGGTTMRGYLNNEFRGDFKALANAEYSFPMFELFGIGLRGLAFWDSGYTTFLTTSNPDRNYLPNSQARGLDPFRNSVGVGIRLHAKQIVLPLLGLDVGYGLEVGDIQVYLAIGLTD